jgi:imidazolonepropionase-like amidohydrolase
VKALAAVWLGLVAAPFVDAAERPVVIIKDARIVTVAGPVIEKGSVLISGGKVAAVGPSVAVPPGATVIDGAGKTVYPGLIDGLTSLGLVEIQSVPGSVDTAEVGDVNPHARAWVALNPHSEQLPVARANGITTALAAPTGGLISGQSALIRLAGATPDALTVKTPVALHVVFPSGRPAPDPARLVEDPEPKTFEERQKEKKKNKERGLDRLRNLLEEAKAYGAALDASRAGGIDPPRPDVAMEALAPFARGAAPVVMRADDEEDIRAAVRFAEERGLKLIVAGGLEGWRCAGLLAAKGVPVLLKVDRLPDRESDPYDAVFANAARLHEAGVRFAIVSDDADTSRNLPYEAAMARAFGLPAAAAIRAITLSPAEIFGVDDRLGSLVPGKDANVVVATGDLLDHRTAVTHVFIDGVAQSLETRHTRLFEQFKDRP